MDYERWLVRQLGTAADELDELRTKLAETERQRDGLVAAMKKVEWVVHPHGGYLYCPWCDVAGTMRGHEPDCQRQSALAPVEGSE